MSQRAVLIATLAILVVTVILQAVSVMFTMCERGISVVLFC